MACPVCGGVIQQHSISAREIGREIALREHFVEERLARRGSPAEMKDLTDFMHGFAAPVRQCASCGLLIRAERQVRNADSYSKDSNDPGVMAQLFPRYVQAFRNKAPGFRDALRPHADVLEIGSHLGAFLQVAEEWNWRPVGLDVGDDTASFARANGLTVQQAMIDEDTLRPNRFDAVFVWNCFEQLTDPGPTLRSIRRVLRRHGLLVLRVPNASFYRAMHGDFRLLAWNNLLGFPYLYGYTERLVTRLAADWGFEYIRGFNSELVTLPFADLSSRLHREQRHASKAAADRSRASTERTHLLTGPWIEMIYRKVEEPVSLRRGDVDFKFLARAA